MSSFKETNPDIVFKPDLKTMLNQRTKLDNKRKNSKNILERIKLSSLIANLDKQIMDSTNLKTK